MADDIHKFKKRLISARENIQNSDKISPENKRRGYISSKGSVPSKFRPSSITSTYASVIAARDFASSSVSAFLTGHFWV